MSIQAMNWAFETELPLASKFVLVALARYADERGACWPSQATLAQDTGQSERSVRNQLNELEKLGFIIRQKRERQDGGGATDLFVLQWSRP